MDIDGTVLEIQGFESPYLQVCKRCYGTACEEICPIAATGESRFAVSVVPNLSKGLKKGFSTSRGGPLRPGRSAVYGRVWSLEGSCLRIPPGFVNANQIIFYR